MRKQDSAVYICGEWGIFMHMYILYIKKKSLTSNSWQATTVIK